MRAPRSEFRFGPVPILQTALYFPDVPEGILPSVPSAVPSSDASPQQLVTRCVLILRIPQLSPWSSVPAPVQKRLSCLQSPSVDCLQCDSWTAIALTRSTGNPHFAAAHCKISSVVPVKCPVTLKIMVESELRFGNALS